MMDTNWSNPDVVNAYRKQQEFAADTRRRKQEERAAKAETQSESANPSLIAPVLAAVGQTLVNVGNSLQTRYGQIKAETAAPKLAIRE